jgi:hypothetical protein
VGVWEVERGGMLAGYRIEKKNKSKVLYIIKFFDKNISQDAVTPWDI